MATYLLEASVLIALGQGSHEFYLRADSWLMDVERFLVCPTTEGALVRHLVRQGQGPDLVSAILRQLRSPPAGTLVPDDLSYVDTDLAWVTGCRQVTDAHLVALAAHHGAPLAALDASLSRTHPADVFLVPELA